MTESECHRIAIIGLGEMAAEVLRRLRRDLSQACFGAVERDQRQRDLVASDGLTVFSDTNELIDWKPDLTVECAGHGAVVETVPKLLARGLDCVVASIGATATEGVVERLERAASDGDARLIYASGAIGGLDALRCARRAKIRSVIYTGRKPPDAWRGSPAEQDIDLDTITKATTFFAGNVRNAALRYPKNTNVTAAVALAGIGFEATEVQLVADPAIERNVHELRVEGDFGVFEFEIQNHALPTNPRTSMLAALSLESSVVEYFGNVGF